jgi:photosystem II stability/assembly factor-like uncharacterized protein
MRLSVAVFAISAATFALTKPTQADDAWRIFDTGTKASLRGLAAVNKEVAWACGSKSTLVQTVDGGKSWKQHSIPNLPQVEIRSIHAWDADRAIVATAGQPALILKTVDRGVTWKTTYENKSPEAFIDGMKFSSDRTGFAFSDPIDGGLLILKTDDAGESWNAIDSSVIPKMDSGEAGFAASNSSLHAFGKDLAWIGLGGGSDGPSRIFRTQNGGAKWSPHLVPSIARGKSSGIFSVAFGSDKKGIAVGGDYAETTVDSQNIATTNDGGVSWQPITGKRPRGFRSCVIAIPASKAGDLPSFWLTCGPSGCEWSLSGEEWLPMSDVGFHVVDIASDGSIWACGSEGRIAQIADIAGPIGRKNRKE